MFLPLTATKFVCTYFTHNVYIAALRVVKLENNCELLHCLLCPNSVWCYGYGELILWVYRGVCQSRGVAILIRVCQFLQKQREIGPLYCIDFIPMA